MMHRVRLSRLGAGFPLTPGTNDANAATRWVISPTPRAHRSYLLRIFFFKDSTEPGRVGRHFLDILRASVDDERDKLHNLVPDQLYRSTFLKLSRSLAPTGKTFEQMEIRAAGDAGGILLFPETRASINKALRDSASPTSSAAQEITICGTLRAVHLDKDWLDLGVDGESVHIDGVKETIDDIIGPMVNKPVLVRALRSARGKLRFVDIERDE